ncbi:MAG TPA: DUF1786 family protein, partial [Thermoleophilia bacterium]|nr:DUF1786 family protein [Thermoleophilia bacterium]
VAAADTGTAALLGALEARDEVDGAGRTDAGVRGGAAGDAVLVNVGNGHTVCAVALQGRIAGVYEDHTSRLDAGSLKTNLRRFLAGELGDDEVRQAGGHGAALGGPVPAGLPLLVTGPHRELLRAGGLAAEFPAPYGDMMMTGPAGLVAAWLRRHGGQPGD